MNSPAEVYKEIRKAGGSLLRFAFTSCLPALLINQLRGLPATN
jgi:hypothetical protein